MLPYCFFIHAYHTTNTDNGWTRTYTTTAKVHVSSDKAPSAAFIYPFCVCRHLEEYWEEISTGQKGEFFQLFLHVFGEDSTQVSSLYVTRVFVSFCFYGSNWRLKVKHRLRIKHTVDKWADTHKLTHGAHGVGVQCWKWRKTDLVWTGNTVSRSTVLSHSSIQNIRLSYIYFEIHGE